ncbi:MAG: FHA domain-containing protein [Fuerstia sp.]|nr:FHA domain-containing protein [Fuerstiella sp.]
MPTISCDNETLATLHVNRSGQPRGSQVIREDECLAVGSDPSADICLVDDDVASTHCMIIARGGVVTVRDCFSETGTFVDRVRVREMQLQTDAELRVGKTTISVKLSRSTPQPAPVRDVGTASFATSPGTSATTAVIATQAVKRELTENRNPDDSARRISTLESQLQQANAEIEVLQTRLTAATVVAAPQIDPYADEMLELLRAEILDLQNALADRDQSPVVRSSATEVHEEANNILSKPDSEKLVERLEQLLLELQQRDDQIATLTELLEIAEAANRAEREERSQIDSWLRDIERRCSDREHEWLSQRTKLQAEMAAIAAERDRAEAALNANSSNVKLEAAQNILTSLRDTAEAQRQKLQNAEQTIAQLQRELESAKHVQPREERMQLAEERSEIARLRQELEAERQRKQNPVANDENLKFQALRQHLNEIHEQEQKEREERKLSSRIARLWQRLDGR